MKDHQPVESRISTSGTSSEEQLTQGDGKSLETLHRQGIGCHKQHGPCVSTLNERKQNDTIVLLT